MHMELKKIFSVFFIFLISVSLSFAQNSLLKGWVTTFDSIPLIDATIIVKSAKEELRSDSIGYFSFRCNYPEKIKVKANGFISETVKLKEGDTLVRINLNLSSAENALEKATSSGHVKDTEIFYDMASSKNVTDYSNYRDVHEIIRNSSSGVIISGNDIIIRGKQSYGSDAALIILDGVPISSAEVNRLSPSIIKSVNILKGPAAATYGVRGANGVVEIETKRGLD